MIQKMRFFLKPLSLLTVAVLVSRTHTSCTNQNSVASIDGLKYPETKRVEQVDNYYGVEVADPYRWLEEMDSPETKLWVDSQEKLFNSYVKKDVAVREAIKKRIQEITDVDTYSAPFRAGNRYFFTKTEARKSQSVVYIQESLDSEPEVLLDPYELLKDTPELSFAGYTPSPDGNRIAYRITEGQSVWSNVHIMDVNTRQSSSESLGGVSSFSWTKDGNGFYYVRYEVPEKDKQKQATLENPKIYFHTVGTPQSQDEFVYAEPDNPRWLLSIRITHDGHYLIVNVSKGSSFSGLADQIYYRELQKESGKIVKLLKMEEAKFAFEGNNGSTFFFRTTLNAPKNRVIAVDITKPARENWVDVIAEANETLTTVSEIGDRLVLRYNQDAKKIAKVFDLAGNFKYEVNFPSIALVGGFPDDRENSQTFYQLWGLLEPGTIYSLDLNTGKSTLFKRPELRFRPQDFILKQVFYISKDGTRVPMFIAHKKTLDPGKSTPVFMYAYGALAWSGMPWYQPHILAWMELGGIYAFPNIRGGGEYGEEWYRNGILDKKQNGIDDYISAAEWLMENGYTSAKKVIADGQSASGVLAAAAITQRPGLFGGALVDHPRVDMLRYHLFTGATARMRELGSSEDPEQFKTLFAYSPYHNLKSGTCYPATLVVVGENDEVTPPLHGYKFTAALQALQSCDHPALIKVVRKAGHVTYGINPEERAQTWAEIWSFFVRSLDMDVKL